MFRVRYKGEQFFGGSPQKKQIDVVIDGVPRTFHNHPIFSTQNGDGSYNFTKEEFEPIAHIFEDFEKWEVLEIPDVLVMDSETGDVYLPCPYCENGPKTKKIQVLKMHIARFHPGKSSDLSYPEIDSK